MKKQNTKYVLNEIFVGSYLEDNLGHELKNFMVLDDGTRGIYVVPHGTCSKTPEYVIHVIKTNYDIPKVYEIIAISKVSKNKINDIEFIKKTFNNIQINNIFNLNNQINSQQITYLCEHFYQIKSNKRIYIKTSIKDEIKKPIEIKNDNEICISINKNLCRALHYFIDSNLDENTIDMIFQPDIFNNFFELNDRSKDFYTEFSELPYCIISGRVSLELSMSNLLTYFLDRDENLLNKFLTKFLEIKIQMNEKFIISREEKNIDIILRSNKRVIIIENKIDSDINGKKFEKYSQLTKYWEYINNQYPNLEKHFFILKPDYNFINQQKISTYKYGDQFIIKNYGNLYNSIIKEHNYLPNQKQPDEYQKFIFNEFRINVMYLMWTKAKQIEFTSNIKLKQLTDKLSNK